MTLVETHCCDGLEVKQLSSSVVLGCSSRWSWQDPAPMKTRKLLTILPPDLWPSERSAYWFLKHHKQTRVSRTCTEEHDQRIRRLQSEATCLSCAEPPQMLHVEENQSKFWVLYVCTSEGRIKLVNSLFFFFFIIVCPHGKKKTQNSSELCCWSSWTCKITHCVVLQAFR